MNAVVIVDTTVFCNVLDIPNRNGEKAIVMQKLKQFLTVDATLLLPMAAVYETGNHVAHIGNGGRRRHFAEIFVDQVKKAITGEAPWRTNKVRLCERSEPQSEPFVGRARCD